MTNPNQSRLASLESTVGRLERTCRRQKRISSLLTLGIVGVLALGLARPQAVGPLEGTSLTIVNDAGDDLAWIGDGKRGGEIRLYGGAGKEHWRQSPPDAPVLDEAEDRNGIPAPLTEQQLEEMTLEEAQHALARVAAARARLNPDDETKARLKREFEILIRLIQGLRKAGG